MTDTVFNAPWHIVVDSQGFDNIHHKAEDGHNGDVVATCYQDKAHANLINAAPELLEALKPIDQLFRDFTGPVDEVWFDRFAKATWEACVAIAKATTA
jgi:hypothetical protein